MMQDREYELSHPYYPNPVISHLQDDLQRLSVRLSSVDEFGKAMRGRKRNKRGKRKR